MYVPSLASITAQRDYLKKFKLRIYEFEKGSYLWNHGVRYGWHVDRADFLYVMFQHKGKQYVVDREAISRLS